MPNESSQPPRLISRIGEFTSGAVDVLKSQAFRRVGAVALSLAAVSHVGVETSHFFQQDKAEEIDCSGIGHQPVQVGNTSNIKYFGVISVSKETVRSHVPGVHDNESWESQAEQLEETRGYRITATRLKRSNPDLLKNNDLSTDTIRKLGTQCLEVPGPVVAGWEEMDGKSSVEQISRDSLMSIPSLIKKNPGLKPDPNYVPKEGTLVDVSNKSNPVNLGLVEQVSKYDDLNSIPGETPMQRLALLRANQSQAGAGSVDRGSLLKLPIETTPWMKKHGFSPEDIYKTYGASYTTPNVAQDSKPNQQNIDVDSTKFDYQLNGKQQEIINGLSGITDEQKVFIRRVYPIILGRTQGGYHWNPEAIMAMAISESSWGQSDGAREGNNLFGVKAGTNWNGQTTTNNGTEQNPDGTYTKSSPMVWRKYNSYDDAIDDYAKFIADGSKYWFTDALHCDQTPKQFLDGLEYKLNPKTCKKLPNQTIPGDLEPAHATDHGYVDKTMVIINQFKLQQIADAGPTIKIKSYNG